MAFTDTKPYIRRCPHGCPGDLVDTDILMPEGPLRICPTCGQLTSQCTGTWPSKKDLRRLTRRRRRTLKMVAKILKTNSTSLSLLDVGCSNGAFVWIAQQMGIDAQGVEPGEIPAQQAQARGLKVHQGYLEELNLTEASFDVVTLFEVIEHIKDPTTLAKACHRILRPGGVMVIGTGNTDSWTSRIMRHRWDFFNINLHGGHINFYSTSSVKVLAAKTGFTLKKIRTSSVNIFEKDEVPALIYRTAKIIAELLNLPSRIFNKGHQMEAFLVADKV